MSRVSGSRSVCWLSVAHPQTVDGRFFGLARRSARWNGLVIYMGAQHLFPVYGTDLPLAEACSTRSAGKGRPKLNASNCFISTAATQRRHTFTCQKSHARAQRVKGARAKESWRWRSAHSLTFTSLMAFIVLIDQHHSISSPSSSSSHLAASFIALSHPPSLHSLLAAAPPALNHRLSSFVLSHNFSSLLTFVVIHSRNHTFFLTLLFLKHNQPHPDSVARISPSILCSRPSPHRRTPSRLDLRLGFPPHINAAHCHHAGLCSTPTFFACVGSFSQVSPLLLLAPRSHLVHARRIHTHVRIHDAIPSQRIASRSALHPLVRAIAARFASADLVHT